ncbi:MAG: hypothetical protein AAF804_06845, partial [Bacteroidota bacterium]
RVLDSIQEVAPEAYLVDLHLRKSRRSTLSIKVDTDHGISLELCSQISRKVGYALEDDPKMDFPYVLEVSSPGIGTPLRLKRQYRKEVGRHLQVLLENGETFRGRLDEATEDNITLALLSESPKKKGKAKKEEALNRVFSFEEIKEAKVIII